MRYIKMGLGIIFLILIFVSFPFIYVFFIFGEKIVYSKYTAYILKLLDKLFDKLYTKIFFYIPLFKEAYIDYRKDVNNASLENEFLKAQVFLASQRKVYLNYVKYLYYGVLAEYNSYKKHQILVSLCQDASNPFYRDIFRFLLDYMDDYRIVPGILPLDSNGLLHIKIQIVGIKEYYLSIAELRDHLSIRLTNALSQSNELIDIPKGYWDNATYFPNLRSNIQNGNIIAYIALSIAGKEEISRLKDAEHNIFIEPLEE